MRVRGGVMNCRPGDGAERKKTYLVGFRDLDSEGPQAHLPM